jgi:hypothetical protein
MRGTIAVLKRVWPRDGGNIMTDRTVVDASPQGCGIDEAVIALRPRFKLER